MTTSAQQAAAVKMNMTLELRLTSKRKMTSKIADNLRKGKQNEK